VCACSTLSRGCGIIYIVAIANSTQSNLCPDKKKEENPMASAEEVVRSYLTALKDPSALRDDAAIAKIEDEIASTDDQIQRLRLRQQLLEARTPSLDRFEEDFVTHAKAWADEQGVTAQAFASEGVSASVLRRAGFRVAGGRGRAGGKPRNGSTRSRVTAEEVRAAIRKGTFTIKVLQERSGASSAVVRRVVTEEVEAGRVSEKGTDPDHTGPGRAPTLYKR
jgi:hypothetical protein